MKHSPSLPLVLVATGVALFALLTYDAGVLARALGMPIEGGEGVVAAIALPMSLLLFVFGLRGLRRARVPS
ncbi:hypothetical protein [Arenimonas sp.]|uniref:hypothetical protein n=1 Tax=Arenimonas sp. TaxID=1872635 RepID=UPI0039E2DF15